MDFNDPLRLKIFGVDLDNQQIVLFDGTRHAVVKWLDVCMNECDTPEHAIACTFQGPGGMWFGIDFRTLMVPVYTH